MIPGAKLSAAVPDRPLAPLDAAIGLRQRDGGNAEQRALDGRRDGAGIGDVLGDVLAAVDAGQNEVGLVVGEDALDRHQHAIGRRALHRKMLGRDLAQPQRARQREGMRDAGLVGLRRDDPYIVGEARRDALHELQARGVYAVVVGEQNSHEPSRRWIGRRCSAPIRFARQPMRGAFVRSGPRVAPPEHALARGAAAGRDCAATEARSAEDSC